MSEYKPTPALSCVTVQMVPNGGVVIIDVMSAYREPGVRTETIAAFSNMSEALEWLGTQPWIAGRFT